MTDWPTHDLKVWPGYFDALLNGAKPFEVRKNDRNFQPQDYLRLREWVEGKSYTGDGYTGREVTCQITYVLRDGERFGVQSGYVVLGLKPVSSVHPAGDPAALARRFHETYERLAPSFGYETRKASAVPWDHVPEQNKQLMIAVCAELLTDNPIQKAGKR